MSPSYGMITEPLSNLSLGTRHLGRGHFWSVLLIIVIGFFPPTPAVKFCFLSV